ncbi:hypothetical protein [Agrococcus sp. Ld7]|uniref:hypothetical protein n=1 Tax=Agrococcus sp. Ld7 TaxID=649148 RepID=UPI003866FD5F
MTTQRKRALALLMGGLVTAIGSMIWFGMQLNSGVVQARAAEVDPMAFLFADAGTTIVTLIPLALILLGIVAVAIGYRRFVEPGPAAQVHNSEYPGFMRQAQGPTG